MSLDYGYQPDLEEPIIAEFDRGIRNYFEPEDVGKGSIEVKNHWGELEKFPLKDPIRILCLDTRQKASYIIIQRGITMHSRISFRKAGELLRAFPIDLILSQRQRLVLYRGHFITEIPQPLREKVRAFLPEEEQQAA